MTGEPNACHAFGDGIVGHSRLQMIDPPQLSWSLTDQSRFY